MHPRMRTKLATVHRIGTSSRGRYWDRTSALCRVKVSGGLITPAQSRAFPTLYLGPYGISYLIASRHVSLCSSVIWSRVRAAGVRHRNGPTATGKVNDPPETACARSWDMLWRDTGCVNSPACSLLEGADRSSFQRSSPTLSARYEPDDDCDRDRRDDTDLHRSQRYDEFIVPGVVIVTVLRHRGTEHNHSSDARSSYRVDRMEFPRWPPASAIGRRRGDRQDPQRRRGTSARCDPWSPGSTSGRGGAGPSSRDRPRAGELPDVWRTRYGSEPFWLLPGDGAHRSRWRSGPTAVSAGTPGGCSDRAGNRALELKDPLTGGIRCVALVGYDDALGRAGDS